MRPGRGGHGHHVPVSCVEPAGAIRPGRGGSRLSTRARLHAPPARYFIRIPRQRSSSPFPLDAATRIAPPGKLRGRGDVHRSPGPDRALTAHPLRVPRRQTCGPAGPSRLRNRCRSCPAFRSPPTHDRRPSDRRTTLPAPTRPGGPRGGRSWAGRRTWSSRLRSPVRGGFCSAGQRPKKSRVLMPPVHATWSGGRPSALRKGWRSSGRDSQGRGVYTGIRRLSTPSVNVVHPVRPGAARACRRTEWCGCWRARVPPRPRRDTGILRRNCFPPNGFCAVHGGKNLLCERRGER